MVDKWHKEIGWSFCTPLSLYSLCMQSSISHTHFGNACVWFSHSSWSRWRIFLASLQKWSLGFSFECCCHNEAKINLRSCQKDLGQKMTPVKVRDVLIKSWLLSSENSPQQLLFNFGIIKVPLVSLISGFFTSKNRFLLKSSLFYIGENWTL